MAGIDVTDGSLRLKGALDEVAATYVDSGGSTQTWDRLESVGPAFLEETTYQLYVAGDEVAPIISHDDPLFLRNLHVHARQRIVSGTFNFGRQVGRTSITVWFGSESLVVDLEVFPTKIDYATDYRQMTTEVQDISGSLALAFLRATHQSASLKNERNTQLEWLATLRETVGELELAFQQINRRPFRHLARALRSEKAHRLKRPDSVARRSIMRGKGSGRTDYVSGIGPVRERVLSVSAQATLDTPEHQWLAQNLEMIRDELESIDRNLEASAWTPDQLQSQRMKARRAAIETLTVRVERMRMSPVLGEVSSARQAMAVPSLTLMSAPGYQQAYNLISSLSMALRLNGDTIDVEVKDLHDLYEIWCFLTVLSCVADITGATLDLSDFLGRSGSGLQVSLHRGSRCEVHLASQAATMSVSYNPTFEGETGTHRPDIVVSITYPTKPTLMVVLDAKYRVDSSTGFRDRHGSPGPPVDAINELHRYRDAIVIGSQGDHYRPIVRGAALFPLTIAETGGFAHQSRLFNSLSSLGIGALPLLPGNTDLFRSWFAGLLALPQEDITWNGPPGPRAAGVVEA